MSCLWMSCVVYVVNVTVMYVLWVYLHVLLSGLDVLLDNGLYLFPLLIPHSFSTFLHFHIPTHLHRLLLMSLYWSLFRLSCHYRQTVNMYFIIYPSFSLSILYFLVTRVGTSAFELRPYEVTNFGQLKSDHFHIAYGTSKYQWVF